MLVAEGLAVLRGDRLVFRDLSFTVAAGAALVLAGPNGSGKSTLLRLLAGLRRPDAGRLAWEGREEMPNAAYLGHLDAVKPGLTVAENLAFSARLTGRDRGGALNALGLRGLADLPSRLLSAGQKRRLALARLVLSDSPLWLLDEPTLGLDAASVERLRGLLAGHRDGGGVVVAATHLPLPLPGASELRLG